MGGGKRTAWHKDPEGYRVPKLPRPRHDDADLPVYLALKANLCRQPVVARSRLTVAALRSWTLPPTSGGDEALRTYEVAHSQALRNRLRHLRRLLDDGLLEPSEIGSFTTYRWTEDLPKGMAVTLGKIETELHGRLDLGVDLLVLERSPGPLTTHGIRQAYRGKRRWLGKGVQAEVARTRLAELVAMGLVANVEEGWVLAASGRDVVEALHLFVGSAGFRGGR